MKPSSVYFIGASEVARVKIGWAVNPRRRFAALGKLSPVPLLLLGFVPGTADHERAVHAKFRHLRETGEWFRNERDLQSYIALTISAGCFVGLLPKAAIRSRPDVRPHWTVGRAIAAVGSIAELARRLGITTQAIRMWDKIPADRAWEVERVTNRALVRYEMRPDVWPPEEYQPGGTHHGSLAA